MMGLEWYKETEEDERILLHPHHLLTSSLGHTIIIHLTYLTPT
jgi:hypothetical protein